MHQTGCYAAVDVRECCLLRGPIFPRMPSRHPRKTAASLLPFDCSYSVMRLQALRQLKRLMSAHNPNLYLPDSRTITV
jgi:hypothetical protein